MKFLNPTVTFDGLVQIDGTPSANNHAITKSFMEQNAVVGIHSGSANYAEIVTVDGKQKLKIKPLQITDVSVNDSANSLAAWISANYSGGTEKQEGDVIILTGTSASRPESYIHNGGSAGSAADFTEIKGGDVQASEVRAFLSGSAGVNYDANSGAITADQGEIRGFFSAGTGLAYSGGAFSLNADTDDITEAGNLFHTASRARSAISVSGSNLTYNAGTGVLGWSANTDAVAEGETNLYHTTARARGAISADPSADNLLTYASGSGEIMLSKTSVRNSFSAGAGLSYSGGQFAFSGNTGDVAEGSNLYYTDARARAAISVSGSLLSYNSGTGAIGFSATTQDIAEHSSNKYFTNARAQAAISADADASNLVSVSGGVISLLKSKIRKEFASQALSANTWATLTHNLGEKLVQVASMNASGELVQLEVQFVDANSLKVKSNEAITLNILASL
jgi:hypothetical protein